MTGFILYEFLFCSLFIKVMDTLLWYHHFFVLFSVSSIVYYEKGHFGIVGTGALDDIVMPFTILRWMLFKVKIAGQIYRKLNQILILIFFHCRSLNEAYFFYLVYSQWNTVLSDLPFPIFCILGTSMLCILFILTPYWTYFNFKRVYSIFVSH